MFLVLLVSNNGLENELVTRILLNGIARKEDIVKYNKVHIEKQWTKEELML